MKLNQCKSKKAGRGIIRTKDYEFQAE